MSEAFVWPELKARPVTPETLEAERRQAVEEGRAAGYQQGLEEGRAAARAELDELSQRLEQSLSELEASVESYRLTQTGHLTGAVHALCRKVLGHELTTSAEALEGVLAAALARLDGAGGRAEVHLNPEDHAVIAPRYQGSLPLHADDRVARCSVSVRLPDRAADFQPLAVIDELFEELGNDLAG